MRKIGRKRPIPEQFAGLGLMAAVVATPLREECQTGCRRPAPGWLTHRRSKFFKWIRES
ncbi:MAG TPA: hypothetical protein VN578_02330 [Candidatus Binatia bacterium]|nr:hypothetical protein [Candidatus Binatia bacterium]